VDQLARRTVHRPKCRVPHGQVLVRLHDPDDRASRRRPPIQISFSSRSNRDGPDCLGSISAVDGSRARSAASLAVRLTLMDIARERRPGSAETVFGVSARAAISPINSSAAVIPMRGSRTSDFSLSRLRREPVASTMISGDRGILAGTPLRMRPRRITRAARRSLVPHTVQNAQPRGQGDEIESAACGLVRLIWPINCFTASTKGRSPDRPSLHLRERNSSMKNRKRESCTSGTVHSRPRMAGLNG
jgi:hypothetical protein